MGLIHIDAGVIIGFLDTDDAHHASARRQLAEAAEGNQQLAIAASAIAECLVAPARRGEAEIQIALELMNRLPISVIHLDAATATQAARLRARHRSLRLPDALVIATAASAGADQLVTTDHRWPSSGDMGLALDIVLI